MFGLDIIVDGGLWRYLFLETCSVIPMEKRIEILEQAIHMDNRDRHTKKSKIKGEHYEGLLWGTGKWLTLLAGYDGYEYRAKIETDQGKYNLGFLLQRRMDPSLN